jgi:hypothetical protein
LAPLAEEATLEITEELSSVRSSVIQQESEANMVQQKKIFQRKNAPLNIDSLTGKKFAMT